MRHFKWLALALALAVLIPSTAQAQRLEKPVLVEITGAWVPTTGAWGTTQRSGWAVGGMLAYAINPAIYLAGNFNTLWWSAESCALCVDYTNYSYFGMIGYNPAPQNAQYDGLLLIGALSIACFPFWLAGTAVLLFLRPRDQRWRILIAFLYLTSIWIVIGSIEGVPGVGQVD